MKKITLASCYVLNAAMNCLLAQSSCPTVVSINYNTTSTTASTVDLEVTIDGLQSGAFQSVVSYNTPNSNQPIGYGNDTSEVYNNVDVFQDTVICTSVYYIDPVSQNSCQTDFCDTVYQTQPPCPTLVTIDYNTTSTSASTVDLEVNINGLASGTFQSTVSYNTPNSNEYIGSSVDSSEVYNNVHVFQDTVICTSVYYIDPVSQNSCQTDFCDTVYINSGSLNTGISQNNTFGSFTITPNPAADFIVLTVDSKESWDHFTVEIVDMRGTLISSTESEHLIKIDALSTGTYFVYVKDKNNTLLMQPEKLIKQ